MVMLVDPEEPPAVNVTLPPAEAEMEGGGDTVRVTEIVVVVPVAPQALGVMVTLPL
jgi:hypothetical protein